MSETAIIPSQTTLNIVGSTITILTQYINENAGGVILAFIMQVDGGQTVDGVPFEMGDGGITIQGNSPPSFIVNEDGELIVTAPDATNFNVDTSTGQLQYIT